VQSRFVGCCKVVYVETSVRLFGVALSQVVQWFLIRARDGLKACRWDLGQGA